MSTQKFFKSALLLTADGLLQRLAGLISTLILARILMPEDFGIVTLALMVIWLSMTLGHTGIEEYLMSKKRVGKRDINSAFTLNVIMKGSLFIVLVIISPFIGDFLNKAEVTDVICVLSLINFIQLFSNPAIFLLKRKNDYYKIVVLGLVVKITRIISTVWFAFEFRNHWAIVTGFGVSTFLYVVGSYVILAYLPRFDVSRIKKQMSFSGWMLLQSVVGYLRDQIDVAYSGALLGAAALGGYNNIKFIANIPILNIFLPLTSPLINNFREIGEDYLSKKIRVNSIILILCLLIFPLVSVFSIFHQQIIFILLGDNWVEYSIVLASISYLFYTRVIFQVLSKFIYLKSENHLLFLFDLSLLVTFLSVFTIISDITFIDFLILVVVIENLLRLPFLIFLYRRYLSKSFDIVKYVSGPIFFSIWVSFFWQSWYLGLGFYFDLIINLTLVLFFSILLITLWLFLIKKSEEFLYIKKQIIGYILTSVLNGKNN